MSKFELLDLLDDPQTIRDYRDRVLREEGTNRYVEDPNSRSKIGSVVKDVSPLHTATSMKLTGITAMLKSGMQTNQTSLREEAANSITRESMDAWGFEGVEPESLEEPLLWQGLQEKFRGETMATNPANTPDEHMAWEKASNLANINRFLAVDGLVMEKRLADMQAGARPEFTQEEWAEGKSGENTLRFDYEYDPYREKPKGSFKTFDQERMGVWDDIAAKAAERDRQEQLDVASSGDDYVWDDSDIHPNYEIIEEVQDVDVSAKTKDSGLGL